MTKRQVRTYVRKPWTVDRAMNIALLVLLVANLIVFAYIYIVWFK